MSGDADLYDRDFVAWTEAQAAELRAAAGARVNLPIDWENVAEEIESLGNNNKRELASRLTTIIEHLLKLRWLPAEDPAGGWRKTVRRERKEVEGLLKQSPSLRRHVPEMILDAQRFAVDDVRDELLARREMSEADVTRMQAEMFLPEQVLEIWWPERIA